MRLPPTGATRTDTLCPFSTPLRARRPARRKLLEILPQQGKQKVILPFAADAQISAGIALLAEAGLEQKPPARGVAGQAGRLDPVQAQLAEAESQHRSQRLGHEAVACVALADPVADGGRLGHPTPDVREADSAAQLLRPPFEQQPAL